MCQYIYDLLISEQMNLFVFTQEMTAKIRQKSISFFCTEDFVKCDYCTDSVALYKHLHIVDDSVALYKHLHIVDNRKSIFTKAFIVYAFVKRYYTSGTISASRLSFIVYYTLPYVVYIYIQIYNAALGHHDESDAYISSLWS